MNKINSYVNSKIEGRHTVPALRSAIRVLETIAEQDAVLTSPQIARRLKISPSSCYRILQTLQAADWVRLNSAGGYEVSFGLLPLVRPLLAWERAMRAIHDDLVKLAGETSLSVKVSVRQGYQQVTIARAESPRPMAPLGRTGSRFPVVWGSSGAALLADVPPAELDALIAGCPEADWEGVTPADLRARIVTCRKEGVCFRPFSKGSSICTASTPLRSRSGAVVAALTLVGLPEDFEPRRHPELKRALLRTAKAARGGFGDMSSHDKGKAGS